MAVVRRAELRLQTELGRGSEELLFCLQPTPPPVATKQQYLCQPLLDAVMTNIRSPVFNHSLYRTFAPAMSAIHGPPIRYMRHHRRPARTLCKLSLCPQ